MSISFNIAYPMSDGGHCIGEVCDCRDIARAAGHKYLCEDFDYYEYCDHIEEMCKHNSLEVNVSNSNGWRILLALGYEPDYCGQVEADDLLGRVLLALGGVMSDRLDVGAPSTRAILAALGAGGARVVDCSPSKDELLEHRLPQLRSLAEAALKVPGAKIGWC